ncbi:MAG: hypothetical protein SPK37_05445 [Candidatus Limisoma sp.]|nr:hypothetical protein [Candidatus Limisoma sp.]
MRRQPGAAYCLDGRPSGTVGRIVFDARNNHILRRRIGYIDRGRSTAARHRYRVGSCCLRHRLSATSASRQNRTTENSDEGQNYDIPH